MNTDIKHDDIHPEIKKLAIAWGDGKHFDMIETIQLAEQIQYVFNKIQDEERKAIDKGNLPIIYHKMPSKKIHVSLIAVPIATISFSNTTRTWFINFMGISDVVVELETKRECVNLIAEKVVEFLSDVYEG